MADSFCGHCGAPLGDIRSPYCSRCGGRIEDDPPTFTDTGVASSGDVVAVQPATAPLPATASVSPPVLGDARGSLEPALPSGTADVPTVLATFVLILTIAYEVWDWRNFDLWMPIPRWVFWSQFSVAGWAGQLSMMSGAGVVLLAIMVIAVPSTGRALLAWAFALASLMYAVVPIAFWASEHALATMFSPLGLDVLLFWAYRVSILVLSVATVAACTPGVAAGSTGPLGPLDQHDSVATVRRESASRADDAAAGARQLASYGSRVAAHLFDSLLIAVAYGLYVLLVLLVAAKGQGSAAVLALLVFLPLGTFLFGVVGLVYFVVGFARGATWGMRYLGIGVVDAESGGRIGLGRAFLRQLVLGPTSCLLGLGYLSPLFDPSGQLRGWHDRAARSLVVRTADETSAVGGMREPARVIVGCLVGVVVLFGVVFGAAAILTRNSDSGEMPVSSTVVDPQTQAADTPTTAPTDTSDNGIGMSPTPPPIEPSTTPAVESPTPPPPAEGTCWNGAVATANVHCDVHSVGAEFAALGFDRSTCWRDGYAAFEYRAGTSFHCRDYGVIFHVAQYPNAGARGSWLAGHYGRQTCDYDPTSATEICGPSRAGRYELTYGRGLGVMIYTSSTDLYALREVQARMMTGSDLLCGSGFVGSCRPY